jgi:hypothetical protein
MGWLSLSLWPVEEIACLNAKSCGDTKDVPQGYVAFPTFDAAHVSAVDSGLCRETFLAQSGSLSQSPYSPAEPLQRLFFRFHREVVWPGIYDASTAYE